MKPLPRIRKTIKWGGAAATILLVAVWAGSGWLWASYESAGGWGCAVGSGLLRFSYEQGNLPTFPFGWSVEANAPNDSPFKRFQSRFVWTFSHDSGYATSTGFNSGWRRSIRDTYDVPLWAVFLVTLSTTAAAWRLDSLARRRARLNRCAQCGYDRAGLAANAPCPECGTEGTSA